MALQRILKPRAWLSGGNGHGPRLRLSAAHDEWNHVGIALVAMEEGFFAEEGLTDIELIADPESAGELLDRETAQVELLAEGTVDIAIDPRTTFVLQARDRNRPVSIVAARRRTHVFLLIGQKGLRSVEDLRGKTIEGGNRGGATDVMMRQTLKDSGLEPDKDVLFTYQGGPMHDPAGSSRAFIQGELGPAKLSSEREARKLMEQGFPVLLDLRKLYPARHDRVTAANSFFVRNHPNQLTSVLKGMIRACRFVLDLNNQARFKEIMIGAGFLIEEREQRSFDDLFLGWQHRVSWDLSLPLEGIERIVDEGKRAGHIMPSFRTEDVLMLEPLAQARRSLEAEPSE